MAQWYQITNPEVVASPALLVDPGRIKQNILEMLNVAGGPERLRPHVKTHKCREIVRMQQKKGITKYKCATIAEAEMLAECDVNDILLAYQPTGPTAVRLLDLIAKYPDIKFSALVDNNLIAQQLHQLAMAAGEKLGLFIDMDVGMHRTGIAPGMAALELKGLIENSNSLLFRGWHLYDGHIRNTDFAERKKTAETAFEAFAELISEETSDEIEIVAGGSPTFPVHALNPQVNLSPGTSLLWDQGYKQILPDQNFLQAAILLTRVISKPAEHLLCLDLGHKAVGSEMPHPRVYFPEIGQVEFLTHSEEHLVIRTGQAETYQVGAILYGIPMHICPTVALHQELVVVEGGKATDRWVVYARNRRINF